MLLSDSLVEKIKNLPENPGVYIMKDSELNILYIGKAISLKNRVRQYFRNSSSHSERIASMVEKINDFEIYLTDSEVEALILEYNLIKKHRPKYNVMLKDDKSYPYIKVTVTDEYPRILFTRNIENDKARYFGPYLSSRDVRETLEFIRKIFPIRSCNKKVGIKSTNDRPCLYYHIKQCQGLCQGNVNIIEYRNMVNQVCKFLEGKHSNLLKDLKKSMSDASDNMQFEKAALHRDRIASIERIMRGQKIVSTEKYDQDVIAIAQSGDISVAKIFFVRGGALIGGEHFLLDDKGCSPIEEIIEAFIKQFYMMAHYVPKEILIQKEINDSAGIVDWLTSLRKSRVLLKAPQKGAKKELVNMVSHNAHQSLNEIQNQSNRKLERTVGALEELAKYLGLDMPPKRIEAFDISNLQGTDSVGSMVVFEDGIPVPKEYRRFKIKGIVGPDDFASMSQVIFRRFNRALEEQKNSAEAAHKAKFSSLPDLILIDGGKGQLNAAKDAMGKLQITDINIIGLAKEFEEVYTDVTGEPVFIPRTSSALHLLQRVRDEAHRFALSYHRSLRKKNSLYSMLDDIQGIGQRRRNELFKVFGSIDKMKAATIEELSKVTGMNKTAAKTLYDYFNSEM